MFGGEFPMLLRYRDFPDNMAWRRRTPIASPHVALPIGPAMLMGTGAVGGEPVRGQQHPHGDGGG